MEIKIQVKHIDGKVVAEETYIMTEEFYDSLSYPEDILHAKISEMRKSVSEAVRKWPLPLPEGAIEIKSTAMSNWTVKTILMLTDELEGTGSTKLRQRWMKVNKDLNIIYKTGRLIRRLKLLSHEQYGKQSIKKRNKATN